MSGGGWFTHASDAAFAKNQLLRRWIAVSPYAVATDGQARCTHCDNVKPERDPAPDDTQLKVESYYHTPGCLWRESVAMIAGTPTALAAPTP